MVADYVSTTDLYVGLGSVIGLVITITYALMYCRVRFMSGQPERPISPADDLRRRGIVLRMRRFHAIVEMLARERPAQHGIHGAQARMRVRRRLHETQALVQSFEDDLESQLALSKATLRKIRQRISMGQKLVHLLQKRYDTLQVNDYHATNAAPAATKEIER